MSSNPLPVERILAQLAEHPPRIAVLTKGLTAAQLRTRPDPDEWSANEVLAHLRSCADVWGDYIRLILTKDRPKIKAVSPRTWIHRTDYPELEFGPSLQAFTTQRADLLALLEPLPPESWSRAAVVTMVGKVLDRTVLDYAIRLTDHERSHVNQIYHIVNRIGL
jgi:hypothetical protein